MALVLLKKIRQSQLLAVAADAAAKRSAAAAASKQQGQGGYGSQHRYNSQQQNYQKSSQQGAGKHGHQQGMVNNVGGAKGNSVSSREKDQYARQLAAAAQLQQQTAAEQKATADLLKQVNLDPKNLPPGLPANLVNLIGKGSLAAVPTGNKLHTPEQPKPKPAPPPPPKVPEETPQQKQAAAN